MPEKTTKSQLKAGKEKYTKENLGDKVEQIREKYGELVEKHCNHIPAGMVCARIYIESRGNPAATAKAQKWRTGYGSEMGLLMLSPDSRKQYGLTEEQAKDPETNIKYACIIWNKWADVFFREALMPEQDKVARGAWSWLVTAIGPGAARRLRLLVSQGPGAATKHSTLSQGYELDRLSKTIENQELMERNSKHWGSQSPELVAWRVGVAIGIARLCVKGEIE